MPLWFVINTIGLIVSHLFPQFEDFLIVVMFILNMWLLCDYAYTGKMRRIK